MKRLSICFVICFSVALGFIYSAEAEPVISNETYVAWIGEEQHLHIERIGEKGSMVLRSPIGNLVALDGDAIFVQTTKGTLYRIDITNNKSSKIADAPQQQDLRIYTNQAYVTVEDGVLYRNTGTSRVEVDTGIITACRLGEQVISAKHAGDETLVQKRSVNRMDEVQTVASVAMSCVSMTVTEEAVTLMGEDGTFVVVDMENGERQTLPAPELMAEAAAVCRGNLLYYHRTENGLWSVGLDSTEVITGGNGQQNTAGNTGKKQATNSDQGATKAPVATPVVTPQATPMPTAAVTTVPTVQPASDAEASAFNGNPVQGDVKYGSTGKKVRYIQQRLKELGYFSGVIDGDYGRETLRAVMLFQHAMGYKEQGYLTTDLLDLMFSPRAITYDQTSPLKRGDKGTPVLVLQEKLLALGFDPGTPDGDYGRGTEKAVKRFQKYEGLPQTGVADRETLSTLYAYGNKKVTNKYTPTVTNAPVGEYNYPDDWVGPATW